MPAYPLEPLAKRTCFSQVHTYLRTCAWSNGTHHPICSNRGTCEANRARPVCNCDPGFYPSATDTGEFRAVQCCLERFRLAEPQSELL